VVTPRRRTVGDPDVVIAVGQALIERLLAALALYRRHGAHAAQATRKTVI